MISPELRRALISLLGELDQRKESGVECVEVAHDLGGVSAISALIELCCNVDRNPDSMSEVKIIKRFAIIGLGVCLEIFLRRSSESEESE
jgi:hypothetical protein